MSQRLIDEFIRRHGLPESLADSLREFVAAAASAKTTPASEQPTQAPAPGLTRDLGDLLTQSAYAGAELAYARVGGGDDEPMELGPRYLDLGSLGRGGMGEVRRVHDRHLNRTLAMKILLHQGHPAGQKRFIEEAQVTAQLQHPAIVPLHEIGTLRDGRLYFTMKEIRGETLQRVIETAHRQWDKSTTDGDESVADDDAAKATSRWSLRQLVGDLQRMCEAVAYAHARGVLHRDLKPSNLMIGDFGEVLVLDWGLTRLLEQTAREGETDTLTTDRGRSGEHFTQVGSIVGTPVFMSPEQATGGPTPITAQSDVYSLGTVLYTILDGLPPYSDLPASRLPHVVQTPPRPLGDRPTASPRGPIIPAELKAICDRAMARSPHDRYPHAGELAQELAAWLDGAQRREQAMGILSEARGLKPKSAGLRGEADGLEAQATGMLMQMPPFAPAEAKRPAWELEDRAAALRNEARVTDIRYTQLVRGALTHAGNLELAHAMLAEHYREQHAEAEAQSDHEAAERFEILLRDHDDGRFADYLEGDGALTLRTDPPRAHAVLYRYETEDRRLVPQRIADLGKTPIVTQSLPMGSYVVRVSHPGRVEVSYPVVIERQRHWDGVKPGSVESIPVYLPRTGELDDEHCYVPAGWFRSGGDPQARNGLPAQRLWLDGFVMPRFPVTLAEYLVFLNDLLDQDREPEALAHVPPLPAWEEGKASEEQRELGVIRDSAGRFCLDGPPEKLRWPATMVNWASANAYAEWRAQAEDRPWRLVAEMEHEKASRGVDARFFPWGDYLDPACCAMRLSHAAQGRALKALVDEYPLDESPYGIRGLAGNTHSWCVDAFSPTGPDIVDGVPVPPDPAKLSGPGAGGAHRLIRGGSWRDPDTHCRGAYRDCPPAVYRDTVVGFRIVRTIP